MTHRDAMLLLVDKTDRAMEAVKALRALDAGVGTAEARAEKLIRVAVGETNDLTDAEREALRELIPERRETEQRTETVRFRCTPNERAALELLARKYADGNMSRLILDTLRKTYPTL